MMEKMPINLCLQLSNIANLNVGRRQKEIGCCDEINQFLKFLLDKRQKFTKILLKSHKSVQFYVFFQETVREVEGLISLSRENPPAAAATATNKTKQNKTKRRRKTK